MCCDPLLLNEHGGGSAAGSLLQAVLVVLGACHRFLCTHGAERPEVLQGLTPAAYRLLLLQLMMILILNSATVQCMVVAMLVVRITWTISVMRAHMAPWPCMASVCVPATEQMMQLIIEAG